MSWEQSYSHTVAIGLDRFGAALIFNEPDITISSLCWFVLMAHDSSRWSLYLEGDNKLNLQKLARDGLATLKLSGWQEVVLYRIGCTLEHFWPGHCRQAIAGDSTVCIRMLHLMGYDFGKQEP